MSEKSSDTIRKNIKSRLREIGKNQTWLANEMNIMPGYLSELLNGKKRWNTDSINTVCRVLSLNPEHLFTTDLPDIWAQKQFDLLNSLEEADRQRYDDAMRLIFPDKFK